jgi:hypothetical protein
MGLHFKDGTSVFLYASRPRHFGARQTFYKMGTDGVFKGDKAA